MRRLDEGGDLGEAVPLLAVPTGGREQRRGLELLPGAHVWPRRLAHARELLPLGEGREAPQTAESQLAPTGLGELRALV